MELKDLKEPAGLAEHKKLEKAYTQLAELLAELKKRELPTEIVSSINEAIDALNSTDEVGQTLAKSLRKTRRSLLKQLEKELKLVPKNHFLALWMALGMSAFGIPLGVAFGISLQNMGFLGLGIPLGLGVGLAIGAGLDKKAEQEGRQLSVEA